MKEVVGGEQNKKEEKRGGVGLLKSMKKAVHKYKKLTISDKKRISFEREGMHESFIEDKFAEFRKWIILCLKQNREEKGNNQSSSSSSGNNNSDNSNNQSSTSNSTSSGSMNNNGNDGDGSSSSNNGIDVNGDTSNNSIDAGNSQRSSSNNSGNNNNHSSSASNSASNSNNGNNSKEQNSDYPFMSDDTVAELGDGYIICQLVNAISPGKIPKIHDRGNIFLMLENVNFFLAACESLGVEKGDLFHPMDLYEGRNMATVISCILALAEIAFRRGFKPVLPSIQKWEDMKAEDALKEKKPIEAVSQHPHSSSLQQQIYH